MRIDKLCVGAGNDGRPRPGCQFPRAGDVIVVDMGLQDVRDYSIRSSGRLQITIYIAPWIDDSGKAACPIGDIVGLVSQSIEKILFDLYRCTSLRYSLL